MNQIERALHQEIAVRLGAVKPACLWISPPNGFFIPARTPAEKTLASRLVAQLKRDGMITPGAPDFVFLWDGGCGCIELKRAASKTLLGRVAAGRLSDDQKDFRDVCGAIGVPYVVCRSWADVRDTLVQWGRLPADTRAAA